MGVALLLMLYLKTASRVPKKKLSLSSRASGRKETCKKDLSQGMLN